MNNNKTTFIKETIIFIVLPGLMSIFVILTAMYFAGILFDKRVLYTLFFLWMITCTFVIINNLISNSRKEKGTVPVQYFNKLRNSKKYNMFIIISSVLSLLSFVLFMFNK